MKKDQKSTLKFPLTVSNLPIGIFDSGIGGLSIVEALHLQLPHEDLLYFADQANFPYGKKTPQQILEYSRQAASFLMDNGIKMLVIGCHTASAFAYAQLKAELSIPVIGMIEPTLHLLKGKKRVVILGSEALIHSNVYQSLIQKEYPSLNALFLPSQALIATVEAKECDALLVAKKILEGQHFDALLLGCTHFSHIKSVLQQAAGPQVAIL